MDVIPGTDTDMGVRFDQRPGALEATRGLRSGCADAFSIIGERHADGWRAAIEIKAGLNADQLRALADSARRWADLFDERVDW